MGENQNIITLPIFNFIKGLALCMMVYHHCYGFPDWYVDVVAATADVSNYQIRVALSFNICVSIFAFLTGWAYYYHEDKSCGYSIKKIVGVMVEYGVLVVFSMLLASLFCDYPLTIRNLKNELLPFARIHILMIYAWYIGFYVFMMVLMPYVSYFMERINLGKGGILAVLALACAYFILDFFGLHMMMPWIPCVMVGYMCAKFRVFGFAKHIVVKSWLKMPIGIGFIIVSVCMYGLCGDLLGKYANVGAICAPLFCVGVIMTYSLFETIKLSSGVEFLGGHALNIWLLHGIYSSRCTREVFQPIAYAVNSPFYVIPFVIISSLLVSIALRPVQAWLRKYVILSLKNG